MNVRTAFTVLLGAHAAAHLVGFLEWSSIAASQLSRQTLVRLSDTESSLLAGLWLVCFALLGAAATLRVERRAWWTPALAGALLSQVLVVLAWHSAKFGTIMNVAVFAAAAVAAAQSRFDRIVDGEIAGLLGSAARLSGIVRKNEILRLPPPVRRWLERSGVVGRPRVAVVRLKQRGRIRTSPKASWMEADAVQYFRVDDPAFVWRVKCKMKGVPISGRDRYAAGKGQMLIKALGLVNVVDASDERIAHGALLRFLGEMVWFPSGALSPFVEWEEVGATSARATIRHARQLAWALFEFDGDGRVARISAERYLGGGARAELTPWSVVFSEWRSLHGVEIPVRGDVSWQLAGGEFSYYRWEILDIEYDLAEAYAEARSRRGARVLSAPRARSASA